MSRPHSSSRASLEPPRKSTELVDPGAHELASSDGEEYFSDASEGRRRVSRPVTPSSPIPRTRIEKVDDSPSYGEVPGTDAYRRRQGDAVPDEVEIVAPMTLHKRSSSQFLDIPTTPGGTAIPRTVVEKVDPGSPSHGEVPGTAAYYMRQADATPDVVLKAPDPGALKKKHDGSHTRDRSVSDGPVPKSIIIKVDDEPAAHGEVPGTAAYEKRRSDASPDRVFRRRDSPGSDDRSISYDRDSRNRSTTKSAIEDDLGNDDDDEETINDDFGDDFDEFEEGAQAGADDDFGDFDDGFQGAEDDIEEQSEPVARPQITATPSASFPLVEFDALSSLPDFLSATQIHLDAMFPQTTAAKISELPEPESISDPSSIFPSDRSRSLWQQLITPPPLQPPNWTQSRIRRLFLVSLGVPVDLDEILPPSKQKKLVLPDINLSPRPSSSDKTIGSVARLKERAANESSASVGSSHSQTGASAKEKANAKNRRSTAFARGPPPPPDLDLVAVKRICATTDEKLEGMTDGELQFHVKELEVLTERTAELLDYWLQRRDGLRREKEAFEGVIENLVRHARRVRK